MKAFIFLIVMAFSSTSFAASMDYCSYGGKTMHVVVPSSKTGKALDKVLKSNKSNDEKVSEISNILLTEATSTSNGQSFCDLAVASYKNVSREKCVLALKTSDMGENLVDEYDLHEISTRCKVGVNAMLFMMF